MHATKKDTKQCDMTLAPYSPFACLSQEEANIMNENIKRIHGYETKEIRPKRRPSSPRGF